MPVKDCRGSKNLIKDLLDQADIFTYQIDREINKKFPLLKSTKNKFEKINNYLKESYDTATVPMSVLDSLIANGVPKKDGTRDILFKDKGNIKKYQMIYLPDLKHI